MLYTTLSRNIQIIFIKAHCQYSNYYPYFKLTKKKSICPWAVVTCSKFENCQKWVTRVKRTGTLITSISFRDWAIIHLIVYTKGINWTRYYLNSIYRQFLTYREAIILYEHEKKQSKGRRSSAWPPWYPRSMHCNNLLPNAYLMIAYNNAITRRDEHFTSYGKR